ncbi:MAG: HPr family phosphocarrier protein [Acidobacteria bacterium]|nr:HPr family phosphocarrier protein [Acidobacteriota bacterium]
MLKRELEVRNPLGLHARAAARLVDLTSGFRSRIVFARPGRNEQVDGKSILGILMMAASQGARLWVRVEGPDEEQALAAIEAMFASDFK